MHGTPRHGRAAIGVGKIERFWRGDPSDLLVACDDIQMIERSAAGLSAVVSRLATASPVAAVVLVGSRANGTAQSSSDFDVFVYTDGNLGELRLQLVAEFGDSAGWQSIQEHAFGDGDVWRLKSQKAWLDLMYWTTGWAESQLRRVLVEHRPSMGYSTAFWRSIRDAQVLYERDDWHTQLQRQARQPYPEQLRHNIIRLNLPRLRNHPFSYWHQAAKAIEREDVVSVNHRSAGWLSSYFDIIFALNRVLHPGEKRLLEFVARECRMAPTDLAGSVERLLGLAGRAEPGTLEVMNELTISLEVPLGRENLLTA